MAILFLSALLAMALTLVAWWKGARPVISVVLPSTPVAVALVFFLIRRDIDIGPHGGIIPAWIPAAVLLVVVILASSLVAAILSRIKR